MSLLSSEVRELDMQDDKGHEVGPIGSALAAGPALRGEMPSALHLAGLVPHCFPLWLSPYCVYTMLGHQAQH